MKSLLREFIETVLLAIAALALWACLTGESHAAPPVQDGAVAAWNAANEHCRGDQIMPDENPQCARRDQLGAVLTARGWSQDTYGAWYNEAHVAVVAALAQRGENVDITGWSRADVDSAARAFLGAANRSGVSDGVYLSVVNTIGLNMLCPHSAGMQVIMARAYQIAVQRTGSRIYAN